MSYVLMIVEDFGDYVRGQLVTAESEILAIMATHPHAAVKVDAPAADAAPVETPAEPDPEPAEPAADAAPIPTPEA